MKSRVFQQCLCLCTNNSAKQTPTELYTYLYLYIHTHIYIYIMCHCIYNIYIYIYTGALGIPASTTFKFGGVESIFYYPSASLAIWSTVVYWHPMVCGSEPKSTFNGFDKPRTACHAVSLRHTRGSHSEAAMLALPFEDYRL